MFRFLSVAAVTAALLFAGTAEAQQKKKKKGST